jgi:hypothetical protein
MKKRHPALAMVSLGCSAAPVVLALWTFYLYFFGPTDKKTSEDVLEYGLISLWMIPLVVAGLCLGAFARGFRLACIGVGLVSILCWACIIIADGGLW